MQKTNNIEEILNIQIPFKCEKISKACGINEEKAIISKLEDLLPAGFITKGNKLVDVFIGGEASQIKNDGKNVLFSNDLSHIGDDGKINIESKTKSAVKEIGRASCRERV